MNNNYTMIVTTCNMSMWTMQAYQYLFNIYFSSLKDVYVLCESMPTFPTYPNFHYRPVYIDKSGRWPVEKWSDGLINFLREIDTDYAIIMLDDYWLPRTVDTKGISTLIDYMDMFDDLLRMDLTGDRLYASGVKDVESFGHYDIISAPDSQYQMSLMPGIWKKELLLEILEPGWTPWEVELDGTHKLNARPEIAVAGTRQWPMRIVNSLRNEREWVDLGDIPEVHTNNIIANEWLERPTKEEFDAREE